MKLMIMSVFAAIAFAASAFEKVPEAAMTALKGVRGKNVSTGYVFVDGHFITPPYKIARYGTAIFVNDIQISDQIVPWKTFLATQDGYVKTEDEAKRVETKKAEKEDDLFDAAPAAKEIAAAKVEAQKKADAETAAAFMPNAKSARLVKRIDEYRLEVRRKLKAGNACFFGSNYARVMVEPRLSRKMMGFLPEAMSECETAAELESMCRAKGYPFMTLAICEDLIRNRADYLLLAERHRKLTEEESVQTIIDDGL